MARSRAYVYKIMIATEDEETVSIEFESPDQLREDEQKERAEKILFAVKDNVEIGIADMEVQPPHVVLIDSTTDITNGVTTTHTIKTYLEE